MDSKLVSIVESASAPVAQLDRASDFESAGRPFESGRVRHLTSRFLIIYRSYRLDAPWRSALL